MREIVFKSDSRKRQKKMIEMDIIINLLRNYKKILMSRTSDLFGS